MTERCDLVREAVWGRELSPGEIERAGRGLTERQFPKGSYICHRGDRLDYWTGVSHGLLKMSTMSHSGKAITFSGLCPGGWFGEGSLLKDEPRKYDVVALRDSRLALLNKATFFWLYENSAAFNRFLVRQLNERLGQFIAAVEYDRIHDHKARVARNLAWLFNPVFYPEAALHVDITQEELSWLAGISRQAVNKALQELEDEGLLRVERERIAVVDAGALMRYEG
jgi:CRP/FNR family transcriptional regulator, cyclic AMP receptor protein